MRLESWAAAGCLLADSALPAGAGHYCKEQGTVHNRKCQTLCTARHTVHSSIYQALCTAEYGWHSSTVCLLAAQAAS